MDKEKILNDYAEFKSLSCNPKKVKDCRLYASKFIHSKKYPLIDFKEKDLIDYLNSIKELSPDSQNDVRANTKNFIKWFGNSLKEEQYKEWNYRFRNIDRLCKTQKTESTYQPDDMISESDFEKLIAAEPSIFWKAYFVTLFYGSCRPSELFKLKWSELDFSDKDEGIFFSIYSPKNKRTFLKYIPREAAYYVKQLKNNGSEFVFLNPIDNKLLNRQKAYYEINKISPKALGKEIDLYTLRHSIATINYGKDNVKDDIIAKQMGHSKSMKNVYAHNDKAKLKADAKKIYVGELPQEKKHALELRVEKLEKIIREIAKVSKKNITDDKNSKVANDNPLPNK